MIEIAGTPSYVFLQSTATRMFRSIKYHSHGFFAAWALLTCFGSMVPSKAHAQATVIPSLAVNLSNDSFILFAGQTAEFIVTTETQTTENGVVIEQGNAAPSVTIPVSKWMVNGVQNGNSTYGRLVQQATGFAIYTAPSGNFYGPVTISVAVTMPDGSQQTVVTSVIHILPKQLVCYCDAAVGAHCYKGPGVAPSIDVLNSQAIKFTFHLETNGLHSAKGVIDDAPSKWDQQQHSYICDPTNFVLTSFDYGQDMDAKNPVITYNTSDDVIHIAVQTKLPDLPSYEIRFVANNAVAGQYPGLANPYESWNADADVSKLPFESPITAPPSQGWWIVKTRYKVAVNE